MIKKRVLIFGWTGMLWSVFRETQSSTFDIIPLSHDDCDITIFPFVLNQISLHEPDVILNFAAYTDVSNAEGQGMLEAYKVNTLWAQNIAKAAWVFGIPLIHISTDYVFDGEKSEPYLPTDIPNPIQSYGMSKYLGEELMRREYSDTIIVRTSGLYGWPLFGMPWSKRNFINSLLQQTIKNIPLYVVDDEYTVPTSCIDLSSALARLIQEREEYFWNILHLVSASDSLVSWYMVAKEIEKHRSDIWPISPVSRDTYDSKVKRPKMSTLENTASIILPDWRIALQKYFH